MPPTLSYRGNGSSGALRRALAAGVVDGVVAGQKKLGDGKEGITLLQQRFDNAGQRLRSMQGGIVKQNDGAGLDLTCHPLSDLGCGKFLPVQAVPTGNRFNVAFGAVPSNSFLS